MGRGLIEVQTEGFEDHRAIARDDAMERLLRLAENVAKTPSTVLLLGESGVGKEVIARHIHRHSRRSSGPFIGVSCTALPASLLESELFGHERGAFSGATSRHVGYFERAQGGTLFLDEIGEITLDVQAKLLRVLQERSFYRVGGTEAQKLNVRVLAATNRDLRKCVEEGSFRLDLYYRLNVFPLQVPALRDRPRDIEALARYYMGLFATRMGIPLRGMTAEALHKLEHYSFPGNVRELVNVLERAMILLGEGHVIEPEHLVLGEPIGVVEDSAQFSAMAASPQTGLSQPHSEAGFIRIKAGEEALTDVRRKVILETLSRFDGNRTRTAEALGVSLRTVRNKIRDYRERGINVPESNKS